MGTFALSRVLCSLLSLCLISNAAAELIERASATCPNPQLSCVNTTAPASCCFNSPGGQLLQTQFWDTNPSTGPTTSWTIHGLWPDNCDGSYKENCDSTRDYTDITTILQNYNKTALLTYMNTYWISNSESNEAFWEHEWSTHGTCINTLDPPCYTNYKTGMEIPDFFQTVVNLFQTLPTYKTLSAAGIVPSTSKKYTLAAIQAAIKSSFGFNVYVGCSGSTLYQMYYTFNVRGSVQTGTFVPTSPSGSTSNCPSTGISYLPKS